MQEFFDDILRRSLSRYYFEPWLKVIISAMSGEHVSVANPEVASTGAESFSVMTPPGRTRPLTFMPPMAVPGTAGAPIFDGSNATHNLRIYEESCEDQGYSPAEMLQRVTRYCTDTYMRQRVDRIRETANGDWEGFKKTLKRAWRDKDAEQQMETRAFLEKFKAIKREGWSVVQLRDYLQQYDSISELIEEKKLIVPADRAKWLVQGLPLSCYRPICSKAGIHGDDRETWVYAKILAAARTVIETNNAVQVMEERSPEHSNAAALVKEVKAGNERTASLTFQTPDAPTTQITLQHDAVAEMGRQFAAMALPIQLESLLDKVLTRLSVQGNAQGGRTYSNQLLRQSVGTPATGVNAAPLGADNRFPQSTNLNTGSYSGPQDRPPLVCFGCGGSHLIRDCARLNDWQDKGVIFKNETGRWAMGPRRENAPGVINRTGKIVESIQLILDEQTKPIVSVKPLQWVSGSPEDSEEELNPTEEVEAVAGYSILADVFAAATGQQARDAEKKSQLSAKVDSRYRATKAINAAEKENKYAAMRNPRTGRYEKGRILEEEIAGRTSAAGFPASKPSSGTESVVVSADVPSVVKTTSRSSAFDGDAVKEKVTSVPKAPKAKLQDAVKDYSDLNTVVNQILNARLEQIRVGDILAHSKEVRDFFFKSYDPVKYPTSQVQKISLTSEEDKRYQAVALYTATCPKVRMTIQGRLILALLDTGAEVSVMPTRLANELELIIEQEPAMQMRGVTGSDSFNGVCHAVPIDIGGVVHHIPVFVLDELSVDFILGANYHKEAQLNMHRMEDGACDCDITGANGQVVKFRAAQAWTKSDRTRWDIFPQGSLKDQAEA